MAVSRGTVRVAISILRESPHSRSTPGVVRRAGAFCAGASRTECWPRRNVPHAAVRQVEGSAGHTRRSGRPERGPFRALSAPEDPPPCRGRRRNTGSGGLLIPVRGGRTERPEALNARRGLMPRPGGVGAREGRRHEDVRRSSRCLCGAADCRKCRRKPPRRQATLPLTRGRERRQANHPPLPGARWVATRSAAVNSLPDDA